MGWISGWDEVQMRYGAPYGADNKTKLRKYAKASSLESTALNWYDEVESI